jgi:glyoxylase-like metal-dependent hydrolase (beta-lactamase superfamily II)
MKAVIIPVTPFVQNCSLVWCPDTHEGAVVDPGGDIERILAEADKYGVTITQVLLTHAHIDHAGATAKLARRLSIPCDGPHRGDKFWIDGIVEQGRMFGFNDAEIFEPDRWLDDGDRVQVGNSELEVRHCPGHTPGHVIFYSPADRLAFVGDVLFQGSIGRTDFPGGDYDTLIRRDSRQAVSARRRRAFRAGPRPMSTFGLSDARTRSWATPWWASAVARTVRCRKCRGLRVAAPVSAIERSALRRPRLVSARRSSSSQPSTVTPMSRARRGFARRSS